MVSDLISTLNIRDEFVFVRNDSIYSDVARVLIPNDKSIVLIRGKGKKGIIGVIPHTHFLEICSKGINPSKLLARDEMLTNILRLKDSTPIDEAASIIRQKKPDAVLILSDAGEFCGYLSPNDIRELTDKLSEPVSEEEVDLDGIISSELDITDEFALLPFDAALCDVAAKLFRSNTNIVLIRGKKGKGIVGAISETKFLEICAKGTDPLKALARKHMQTNLLRLRNDTPLRDAIQIVDEKNPDAVLVLSPSNRFVGYLSPQDHRRAVQILTDQGRETLDIGDIKPIISLPPTSIRDIQGSSDELSIAVLIEKLRNGLGSGEVGPVVWQEDGSEILVHNETVRARTQPPLLIVELEANCDQTSAQTITFTFDIGSGEPLNSDACSDVVPEGSKLIVGRWGVIMRDIIWDIIVDSMNEHTPEDNIATGFSAGKSALKLRVSPINPHLRKPPNPMMGGALQ
jgi:predicted transcriptional regulator